MSGYCEIGGDPMKNDSATGASASLNLTITAIMEFLDDEGDRPRSGLREFLYDKLGDLAVKWYRHGFNRGHRESAKQIKNGSVPRVLRYDATREFFTGGKRTVRLKSTLKRRRT
jgi:hypothetical protein